LHDRAHACGVIFEQRERSVRDLVVYGEPTLEKALKSVGLLWRARTGTRVNVFVAFTGLSLAQIERGARCDVIFALAGAATDDAARDKIIHAGTVRRALRNDLVLIGADPAAPSTGGTTLADIGRLIAGKTLAIADPTRDAAGARAAELLRGMGISVDGNKSIAVAESSAGVVSMLAGGRARLGIVYATDATSEFAVALPTSQLPPIDYVVAQARDPALDTQPFIAFLQSDAAKAAFQSAGLQPIDATSTRQQ
jgi:molybdate transport system substrate-binding protein